MIQAVTTLATVVQSHASPNGIYSTKSGTGTGFPLSTTGSVTENSLVQNLVFSACSQIQSCWKELHLYSLLYNIEMLCSIEMPYPADEWYGCLQTFLPCVPV